MSERPPKRRCRDTGRGGGLYRSTSPTDGDLTNIADESASQVIALGCFAGGRLAIKEAAMDFVERILGIAPDGGNGLLELAIVIVPMFMLFLASVRKIPLLHLLTRPTNRWTR